MDAYTEADFNILDNKVKELETKIEKLERDFNQLAQYNRRESIEITGLPDSILQKDLENVCINLLRRIGVNNLESFEISACHRLKTKSNE